MKSVLVGLILLAFLSCASSQCCYYGGYYGGYGGYGYRPYYGYYSPWRVLKDAAKRERDLLIHPIG
ncbi:hypothetical protein ANCDUO_14365 [Ancylostoma duodenale]|uniref:Uncharacterized protein n=1 Tax=Ancylostoma duodenale TaxID=51022 RepID=A0A0C2D0B8_9BILA|nr:hypothetical protein ANCDUO_14365 [Ancylostoma duodenale]